MKKPAISIQIRGLRDDIGLRQIDFALKVGVSPRTLASWEGGVRNPKQYQIHRMLRICSMSHPDAVRLHFPDVPIQPDSEVESPPPGYDKPERGDWEQIAGEWRQIAEERKQKIAELQKIIDSGKIR